MGGRTYILGEGGKTEEELPGGFVFIYGSASQNVSLSTELVYP